MAKAVKTVAGVVGAVAGVALIATGVGAGAGGLLLGVSVKAISAVALGASLIGGVAGLLSKPRGASESTGERLRATLIPSTPRLSVHGRTAMGTDVRYEEFVGEDQALLWRVFACASHRVQSIQELWLDDKLAWTVAGGVTASFAGYLQVTPILEATATNTVYISQHWSAAARRRLTGCALLYVRYKRTGNSKKAESPFASSITDRVTIVGEGRFYYDPRRDSTVPGGSGSMRATDQATWAYVVDGDTIGRNGALGLLNQLLGWKINGKLAVGRGVLPSRFDMASFITAANLCDETVAKAGGGSEPRYRTDGVFSENEGGDAIVGRFESAINGRMIDDGGRLGLRVWHNDLSLPVHHFTADDVLSAGRWEPTTPLNESRNIGRGKWVDSSAAALYQLVDYPQVTLASPDGIDRVLSSDFDLVQSPGQAQRLIKQRLQRLLYGGRFSAEFRATGWAVKRGDVVTLDFYPLAFNGRTFRVLERTISFDGRCQMTLGVEHPSIYAWDREEAPEVTPPVPDSYDWRSNPLLVAIDEVEAAPTPWPDVTDPTGTKPEDNATVGAPSGTPVGNWTSDEVTAGIDDLASKLTTQIIKTEELETGFAPLDGRITAARTRADEAYQYSDRVNIRVDSIVQAGDGDFGPIEVRLSRAETAIVDNKQVFVDTLAQLRGGYGGTLAAIDARSTAAADQAGTSVQLSERLEAVFSPTAALPTNPRFSIWPTGQALPTAWRQLGGADADILRVGGIGGQGSAVGFNVGPGGTRLLFASVSDNPRMAGVRAGWFVVDIDIAVRAGGLTFLKYFVQGGDAQGSEVQRVGERLDQVPDQTGAAPGYGETGRTYSFRRLVRLTDARVRTASLFVGIEGEDQAEGKHPTLYFANLRAATPAEVESGRVAGVIALLDGETFARGSDLKAEAGRITNAVARVGDAEGRLTTVEAVAAGLGGGEVRFNITGQTGDGRFIFDARAGADGSRMILAADELVVAAPVPGGVMPVARFTDEGLQIYGSVQARTLTADRFVVGGLTPVEIAEKAMGNVSGSQYWSALNFGFNSGSWQNVLQCPIYAEYNRPIQGMFNMATRHTAGKDYAEHRVRIIRDDGLVLYGKNGGAPDNTGRQGANRTYLFFDPAPGVNVQRNYALQLQVLNSGDAMQVTDRVAFAQELSRIGNQGIYVQPDPGGGGGYDGGGGGGSGGGGGGGGGDPRLVREN